MRSRLVKPPKPSRTKTSALLVFRFVRKTGRRIGEVSDSILKAGHDVAAAWRESGGRYR